MGEIKIGTYVYLSIQEKMSQYIWRDVDFFMITNILNWNKCAV